jgi:hypothetical protein
MNGKDVEGSAYGLIWGTILTFIWRDWERGKEKKPTTSLWAKIWTLELQNMKLDGYELKHDVQL